MLAQQFAGAVVNVMPTIGKHLDKGQRLQFGIQRLGAACVNLQHRAEHLGIKPTRHSGGVYRLLRFGRQLRQAELRHKPCPCFIGLGGCQTGQKVIHHRLSPCSCGLLGLGKGQKRLRGLLRLSF